MTPAQIVARQTADRMARERMLRCLNACKGISDAALEQDVIGKVRETLERAALLLDIDAEYFSDEGADAEFHYDGSMCDGVGHSIDCENQAERIRTALRLLQESPTHE